MRLLRAILTWGRCPQTPGIFRFAARMDCLGERVAPAPGPIPAAESALGLRSRSALSSAQVFPEWTTSTSPCNNFLSNGDNPLNLLSQSRGSLQSGIVPRILRRHPLLIPHGRKERNILCEVRLVGMVARHRLVSTRIPRNRPSRIAVSVSRRISSVPCGGNR
jgi:hypothetical protein